MKKIILPLIIFSFLFGTMAFAQEVELPEPGLTPDSPFYFLETIVEGIGTLLTFGDIKKAERHALLAAERISEAQAVADKGKPKLIEKTLKRYERQLTKALSRTEKAKTKGKNTEEVAKTIAEAAYKYIAVLGEVLKKAPEEAKPAIEHAMTASNKGNERALEALSEKEKDAFGFESLKAQCIEAGLPPEICASLKDRCKEAGATTSEECERFFSTFRIESSVKPVLSEVNKTAGLSSKALATDNWEVYRNTKYGYSFKYPKGVNLVERDGGNSVELGREEAKGWPDIGILHYDASYYNPPEDAKFIDWIKKYFVGTEGVIKEEFELNGVPAVRIYFRGASSDIEGDILNWRNWAAEKICYFKDGKIFLVDMSDVDSQDGKKFYNSFLSTFKFKEN